MLCTGTIKKTYAYIVAYCRQKNVGTKQTKKVWRLP
jgi:hypothetical protein